METNPKEIVALRNGLSAMTASRLYHTALGIPSEVCWKCLIERNLIGLDLANKASSRGYGVLNPADAMGRICSADDAGCAWSGSHRGGSAGGETSGVQDRPCLGT